MWLWSNEGDTTGFLGLADFPMQYDLLKYTKIKKARLGASSLIAVAKEQPFKTQLKPKAIKYVPLREAEDPADDLCEYEKQNQANIAANRQKLEALGLL